MAMTLLVRRLKAACVATLELGGGNFGIARLPVKPLPARASSLVLLHDCR